MNQRRIYLVRHGETLYQDSSSKGVMGRSILTERGGKQIWALAQIFKEIPLDRIYASPVGRAHETAEILARERGMEVRLAPELRELSPAKDGLTDKGADEILREAKAFFNNPHTTWDEPFLGGESLRQVQERAVGFIDSLLQQDGWETILLVAHGGVNNVIIAHAMGVSGGRVFYVEQDFGCVNIIDYVHSQPLLRLLNFTLYDPLKACLHLQSFDIVLNLLKERGITEFNASLTR